ncbi:uncharacterized protein LOC143424062 [Xylocopa sonorina]|uniref:uncharacterized protein LOC143424062 n=1 Tax=Xylocopa sonorina TaxID=1818115 RepID=UPI00403ACED3
MQVHVTLLAFCVLLVASIEAKPSHPSLYVSDYRYPSDAFGLQSQLVHYQSSPYYLYNVHSNVNTVPTTIIANAKPSVPHVPAYNFYYGNPVYDFRLNPFPQLYPGLKPAQPGVQPRPSPEPSTSATTSPQPSTTAAPSPEPSTTANPTEDNEGGVEMLDTMAEPEMETQNTTESSENTDDDSVVVEST